MHVTYACIRACICDSKKRCHYKSSLTFCLFRCRACHCKDGVRGFYRGSIATLARDVPFSVLFFAMYGDLKVCVYMCVCV